MSELHAGARLTIGKPLQNVQAYIVDEEGELAPIGVVGELCVGGDGVARGYLNGAGLTGEKFIPDQYSNRHGARLYRTGDLTRYLPNGDIEFIGRIDDQVKVRGLRIELGEIEWNLLQITGIEKAVATTVVRDGDEISIAVYLVMSEQRAMQSLHGGPVAVGDQKNVFFAGLDLKLKSVLPPYMLPKYYILLDEMPLNSSGKIDKKSLPLPKEEDLVRQQYVPPDSITERKLCALCQTLLKIEKISMNDNFFSLGGHSLLATRLISAIRKEFNIEMKLLTLFEFPVISDLANIIDAHALDKNKNILSDEEFTI
jgi:acyl carrier protein